MGRYGRSLVMAHSPHMMGPAYQHQHQHLPYQPPGTPVPGVCPRPTASFAQEEEGHSWVMTALGLWSVFRGAPAFRG